MYLVWDLLLLRCSRPAFKSSKLVEELFSRRYLENKNGKGSILPQQSSDFNNSHIYFRAK